jgi:hypothetical protein
MELIPKAEFSIVARASTAWIPELLGGSEDSGVMVFGTL